MTKNTSLTFQKNGAPYSSQFDDIYFDTKSGCQQSEQVFINGNDLPKRLKNNKHPIIIGETGFGTGLNFFLTALKIQQQIKATSIEDIPDVTFISVEKYPLSTQQIRQSLTMWPDINDIIEQTLAQYPSEFNHSCEIRLFSGKLILKLLFGDAIECFSHLKLKQKDKINAWYLDGFSPAQNSGMWSEPLFQQIARLCADDATLATFTVAGFVKRHLINHGFRIEKRNTVGKKKQTLVAKFQQAANGKGYLIRPNKPKMQHVTIIGGGIASACLTYQLAKQGVNITLICKDEAIAQGASSNAIGALYPLIHLQRDEISEFYVKALVRAREFYDQLLNDGYTFSHQWCGLLEVSYKEALQKRQQKFEQSPVWPSDIIQSLTASKASEKCGKQLNNGGMFIPMAGWISPTELVSALLKAATNAGQVKVKIKMNTEVTHLAQSEDGRWQLTTNKDVILASTLVMCGGADSNLLTPIDELPQQSVRGQVTEIKLNQAKDNFNTVLCHKGYITPAHQGKYCIGATFDKEDRDTKPRHKDNQYNLNMIATSLPELSSISQNDIVGERARLRATTPDHFPIAGPMPKSDEYPSIYSKLAQDKHWKIDTKAPYYDNLYVFSGLGARGLCSAPLASDILVADLCNLPYPVSNKMRFNLAPNRFVVKDIIKGKYNA